MNTETKLSRDELKERLRMAQMRGKLGRMPKKHRDEKVEKMKSDMEQQQKAFMEQIKLLTPEQRKAMGIPDMEIPNVATNENLSVQPENLSVQPENLSVQPENLSVKPENLSVKPENHQPIVSVINPMSIPIQLPKMTPVTPINTLNTTQI
jgi:hypothetical protein